MMQALISGGAGASIYTLNFNPATGRSSSLRRFVTGEEMAPWIPPNLVDRPKHWHRVYGLAFDYKQERLYTALGNDVSLVTAWHARWSGKRLEVRDLLWSWFEESTDDYIGCPHQVDLLDGLLYVVDTSHDRVCVFDADAGELVLSAGMPPNPEHTAWGPRQQNNHYNSVFVDGDRILAVAHAKTSDDGAPSYHVEFDRFSGKMEAIHEPRGGDAHNWIRIDGLDLWFDSLHGVIHLGSKVYEDGRFLRGLAVTRDYILVGANERAERNLRRFCSFSILVFDRNLNYLRELRPEHEDADVGSESGSCFEIRVVSEPDFGQSQWSAP